MAKTTKKKKTVRHKFPYAYYPKDLVKVGRVPALGELPEVNFTYRPLDMMQSAGLDARLENLQTYDQVVLVNLAAVTLGLVWWDLKKPDPDDDNKEAVVDFRDIEELKLCDPHVMDSIVDTIRASQFAPLTKAQDQESRKKLKNS